MISRQKNPPVFAGRRMVIEVIDDEMAEMFRRKTPAERLAATHAMWRMAHARTLAIVKHLHPDWDESQVRDEMCRRMLSKSCSLPVAPLLLPEAPSVCAIPAN